MSKGRIVKRHASGDPFVAREILKRHATFPRVKWQEAVAAVAEALVLSGPIEAEKRRVEGCRDPDRDPR